MIQWTESRAGMTETVVDRDTVDSETFTKLVSDLMGTTSPDYAAEVINWWFTDRDVPLVMSCGDIWEWLG